MGHITINLEDSFERIFTKAAGAMAYAVRREKERSATVKVEGVSISNIPLGDWEVTIKETD